jgi:general secretion pathway protein E
VILVGEIRDAETMEIAVRSALTGHLVFSTLHTNDAAGAVPRLLNMGAEPFLLSSSLVGVLGQRLVRLLCTSCREPAELSEGTRRDLRRHGVSDDAMDGAEIHRPVGCRRCGRTGYQGRVGIFEYLRVTHPIQEQILRGADAGQIRGTAVEEGMSTMLREGLRRAFAGETTVDEVLRVAV